MPLSFGSLIGGLITMVGTSPNIIVSRVREEDRASLSDVRLCAGGPGVAVLGLLYITLTYRLLPRDRRGADRWMPRSTSRTMSAEARVPRTHPVVGTNARES